MAMRREQEFFERERPVAPPTPVQPGTLSTAYESGSARGVVIGGLLALAGFWAPVGFIIYLLRS